MKKSGRYADAPDWMWKSGNVFAFVLTLFWLIVGSSTMHSDPLSAAIYFTLFGMCVRQAVNLLRTGEW